MERGRGKKSVVLDAFLEVVRRGSASGRRDNILKSSNHDSLLREDSCSNRKLLLEVVWVMGLGRDCCMRKLCCPGRRSQIHTIIGNNGRTSWVRATGTIFFSKAVGKRSNQKLSSKYK